MISLTTIGEVVAGEVRQEDDEVGEGHLFDRLRLQHLLGDDAHPGVGGVCVLIIEGGAVAEAAMDGHGVVHGLVGRSRDQADPPVAQVHKVADGGGRALDVVDLDAREAFDIGPDHADGDVERHQGVDLGLGQSQRDQEDTVDALAQQPGGEVTLACLGVA